MSEIGKAQIEISIKDMTRDKIAEISKTIDAATKNRKIEIGAIAPKQDRVGLGGEMSERELLQTAEKMIKAEGASRILVGAAKGVNDGLSQYQKAIEEGADKTTAIAAGIQTTAKTAVGAVPIIGQIAVAFYDLGQSIAVAIGLQEDYAKSIEKLASEQDRENAFRNKSASKRRSIDKSVEDFVSNLEKNSRDSGLDEVDRQINALMDKRDAQLKAIDEALSQFGLTGTAALEKRQAVEEATEKERLRIIEEGAKKTQEALEERVNASNKALASIAATIGELDFSDNEKNVDVSKFEQRIKTLNKLREDARAARENGGSVEDLEAIERDIATKAKDASEALMRGLKKGVEEGLKSTADRIAELDRNTAGLDLAGSNLSPFEMAQAKAAQDKAGLQAQFDKENEAAKAEFEKRLAVAKESDLRDGATGTAAANVTSEFEKLQAAMKRNQEAHLQAADIQVKTALEESMAKEQAAIEERNRSIQDAEQSKASLQDRIQAQIKSMVSGVSGFSTLGVTQEAMKKGMELQEQLSELRKQTDELAKINQNLAGLKKTGITVQ